ncbi:MAG: hypothetical protein ABFD16_16225 [Thermoguttaceae bacterium]|jgi:prophage DNA circulation protein
MTALETARRRVALYQQWIAADREAFAAALEVAEQCEKAGLTEAATVHRETARLCEELVAVQQRILNHWELQLDRCQGIALRRGEAKSPTQASA